jgi:hypothetical protein
MVNIFSLPVGLAFEAFKLLSPREIATTAKGCDNMKGLLDGHSGDELKKDEPLFTKAFNDVLSRVTG